jgi:hypothetical protein
VHKCAVLLNTAQLILRRSRDSGRLAIDRAGARSPAPGAARRTGGLAFLSGGLQGAQEAMRTACRRVVRGEPVMALGDPLSGLRGLHPHPQDDVAMRYIHPGQTTRKKPARASFGVVEQHALLSCRHATRRGSKYSGVPVAQSGTCTGLASSTR